MYIYFFEIRRGETVFLNKDKVNRQDIMRWLFFYTNTKCCIHGTMIPGLKRFLVPWIYDEYTRKKHVEGQIWSFIASSTLDGLFCSRLGMFLLWCHIKIIKALLVGFVIILLLAENEMPQSCIKISRSGFDYTISVRVWILLKCWWWVLTVRVAMIVEIRAMSAHT